MFELISLEDSFLRKAFQLDGADFKVLSFCHYANQNRSGKKLQLSFADVTEALELTGIEIREALVRLAGGGWLDVSDLTEEAFVYEVRRAEGMSSEAPAGAPAMALQHLAFDGTVSAAETTAVQKPAAPAPNPLAQGLLIRMVEKIADPRVRQQESVALQALLRAVPADTIVGALRTLGPDVPHRFTELLSRFSSPEMMEL